MNDYAWLWILDSQYFNFPYMTHFQAIVAIGIRGNAWKKRDASQSRRRRCGICTELCPCNAAVGHQRIPALPTRHGKECVLAVDACAKCPGRSDAKRRRCGAPRVGDHLLRGVLPIARHVRGRLRIGWAHSRLGDDDGGRLRSALPRGGAWVGLLSGKGSP